MSKSLTFHDSHTHTHMHTHTHKHIDAQTHTLKATLLQSTNYIHFYIIAVKDLRTPPVVISHPKGRNASISSMVTLFCNFSGVPSPMIRWYKDGQDTGVEGNSFILAAIKPEERGVYHCEATNERGTAKSQEAVVLIQGAL